MSSPRSRRADEIARELRIEAEDADGWRAVTLDGEELGLLRPTDEGWRLQWRLEGGTDWRDLKLQLDGQQPLEVAETWAVHEIADFLAMQEQAESR